MYHFYFTFFTMLFSSLPLSAAAIYVNKYFNKKSKDEVTQMATNIKAESIELLKRASWMDDITRAKAIEKANAMDFNVAYPDELTDDTKLEEYYSVLELQPDSQLHSALNVRKFIREKDTSDFRKPVVKNDWREIGAAATEVNAFYYPSKNMFSKVYNKEFLYKFHNIDSIISSSLFCF